MRYPLSVILTIVLISFLLVNFPIAAVTENTSSTGNIPDVYLYFYSIWAVLVLLYYYMFRKVER